MFIDIHPYVVFSILSAIVTLIAAIAAWRRSAPGASALRFLLLGMAIWSMSYATRWLDISVEAKLFWFKVMFVGVTSIPTLFLIFALSFTRNESWLTPRNLGLLSLPPLLFLLLQWTNPYHHLMYQSLNIVQDNDSVVMEIIRGPWYLINVVYSYVVIGIGMFLLSQGALRSGPLYRYQYQMILVASLLPWAGNIFKELNFSSYGHLDLAPLTFGISGIIFALAILRTHFMDVVPVARSQLIETMQDGILVLDAQNRIVDINPAMEKFIKGKASSYLGKNAYEALQPWMGIDEMEIFSEKTIPLDSFRYLDVRVTPLYDKNQLLNGRLMVFRDVTERKQVEKRLRQANDKLQGQLIEIGMLQSKLREQAIRDPLTNLFNRRYLEETLERELSRAARENYPICLIMMDIDHFKRVNDTYGHEAGDLVLKAISEALSEHSRRGDFACRFGGEEFVVVMPNMNLETAYERAEHLRQSLNLLRVPYEYYSLSVTISMGIACYPENGQTRETILRAADQAMYGAKEAGRDHILSYNQLQIPEKVLED
ncbi:MAG TPA: histidine kinase N-terminal 7TM domain-containing protein [Anaerolineales bacterium]|jgi:diguanylate cyclase (GGDEF)-like protein/PAS domain S-box-containing protein|nr:histidine kinase N-terminal 7TM domain-containing protein [Anaerolineales bacterium]